MTDIVPPTYQAAALRLVNEQTMVLPGFRARQFAYHVGDPPGDLCDFRDAFLKALHGRNMPFFVHCLYRGPEDQKEVQQRGNSRASFGQSPHNWSMAIDVVHYGRYWELTEKEWHIVGLIGKDVARRRKVKMVWGGDWSFWDPAHWELADWRERVAPRVHPISQMGFSEAFGKARAAGLKTFEWRGKQYTTELA